MLDRFIRPRYERMLGPIITGLGDRIHPHVVSITAAALGVSAAVWCLWNQPTVALVLWLVSRVLDGLDGSLARAFSRQSDLGGYLDIVLDFMVYTSIPLGIAQSLDAAPVWRVTALMLGVFYINSASWIYLSALLEKRRAGAAVTGERTSVTMPRGLVEGFETILLYSLMIVWPHWVIPLMLVMTGLVGITIVYRFTWAVAALGEPPAR